MAYTPLNDVLNGEIVIKDGRLTGVNETDLLGELREAWREYRPAHQAIEAANGEFVPAFAETHRRCASMDIGINRYGSDLW